MSAVAVSSPRGTSSLNWVTSIASSLLIAVDGFWEPREPDPFRPLRRQGHLPSTSALTWGPPWPRRPRTRTRIYPSASSAHVRHHPPLLLDVLLALNVAELHRAGRRRRLVLGLGERGDEMGQVSSGLRPSQGDDHQHARRRARPSPVHHSHRPLPHDSPRCSPSSTPRPTCRCTPPCLSSFGAYLALFTCLDVLAMVCSISTLFIFMLITAALLLIRYDVKDATTRHHTIKFAMCLSLWVLLLSPLPS